MDTKPAGTVELYCRELGGKGRAPLVVLHDLLGQTRNWQTAGADLAHAGAAHVLALDLRNHGHSPRADSMTFDEMAADVVASLDARGLMRALLMGHGIGGKVAMAVACRFPQRVGRLIVVDTAPKDCPPPALDAEFAAMNALDLPALRRRDEAEAHFESLVRDEPARKFLLTNLERDKATGGWKWAVNLPAIAAALPGLGANPLRRGDLYEGETLFVTGEKSGCITADDTQDIARHFPNARIETIASSGHNPHLEAREEFVQIVTAFLKR